MNKKRLLYFIITLLFIIISIMILLKTDVYNNVYLSKSIQIILILYLIRLSYGITLYIRKIYKKQKYSYNIILNLGLLIFVNINILRQINLLIQNWNELNIIDIYNNTLESFSYFVMLILPFIIIFSIYSIISNILLIKKEGFNYKNLFGIILGLLALFGLFGTQTLYIIVSKLLIGSNRLIVKKIIDLVTNITLSYFYTLMIATLYCNIKISRYIPKMDKDFIIILGSKIKNDGDLSPLLKGRVDKALEFGRKQYEVTNKQIYYVTSGGKGSDEVISEAEAMKNYLIKNGIDKKYIIVEDKSTSTYENMKFSKLIINKIKENSKISFSTTNYHVFRSGVIAYKCGIDCEGIGSPTKWYFYTNALIREFIATIYSEKMKHIILLLIINISCLLLILVGYYFEFLYVNR